MANGKYNLPFILIGIVLMLMVFQDVEATLKTTFIEDICYDHLGQQQKTASLSISYIPSGILMSTPYLESNQSFDCEVILKPARGSSVVVSIYRYEVNPGDILTIEDSDRFMIALTGYGYFRDEKKAFISDGITRIRYRRNATSLPYQRQGFQFTYSAVTKYNPCFDNEFQCKNRFCILRENVCDGHNHCGDRSDETDCVPKNERVSNPNKDTNTNRSYQNPHVIWISIIGAVGVVVFIIVIVFFVVVVRRSNTRKPKAPAAPNSNNPNSGGNVPLETVSSTVPQQSSVTDGAPSAPPAPEHEGFSIYTRIRRSLRGPKSTKTEDLSKEIVTSEVPSYQVPAMYPSLNGPTSLEGGIENPEFKSDES